MNNRLAIIVVGELRTWERCAPYTLALFDKFDWQIDYFFSSWTVNETNTGPRIVTEQDILTPFQNKNLNCVYSLHEPIGTKVTTYYNKAYLSKMGNILKRQKEIDENFVYDQVIELRPDVYYRPTNDFLKFKLRDSQVITDGSFFESNHKYPGTGDVYYRSTSLTNDIISNRYYHRKNNGHYSFLNDHAGYLEKFHNHHLVLADYLLENRLTVLPTRDIQEPHLAVRYDVPHDVNFDQLSLPEAKTKYQPQKQPDIKLNNPIIWH